MGTPDIVDDNSFDFSTRSSTVEDDDSEVIDLGQVDENVTFKALPPGTYEASVDNVEYGRSSQGNRMLTWRFKVTDPDTGRARRLFLHTVLLEDSLPRLKRILMRVAPDILDQPFKPASCAQLLVGRTCRVKVGTEVYNGQVRNRVLDVLESADSFFSS